MWRRELAGVDASRLVFVDECGSNTGMARARARAPRGERAVARVPRNRGANTTIVASITLAGRLDAAAMVLEGATDSAAFEAYVEKVLCPALAPGQVVAMDNLSAHKRPRIRELVEAAGCELRYLPSYSPDLNPIEEAFSKLKAALKKAAARTKGALIEAIGAALATVTASDAAGYFAHCGYKPPGQDM